MNLLLELDTEDYTFIECSVLIVSSYCVLLISDTGQLLTNIYSIMGMKYLDAYSPT